MKYLRTTEILATFGRPWPICEKVGCRWLTCALPTGTKLGTAVGGVEWVHAAQAAGPPRHFAEGLFLAGMLGINAPGGLVCLPLPKINLRARGVK